MAQETLLPAATKKRRRTPKWIKELGHQEQFRRIACFLTALYIKIVWSTGRWTIIGEEHPQTYWKKEEPFLLAFWHGRLLMMPKCWRTSVPMNMLISNHRDGAIISDAIARFGIGSIRGSTAKSRDKGGARALRAMVKAVKGGESIGITPDGPSGPYMNASDGVCAAAKLSGAPILPAAVSASRRRIMNSWDRFMIPLPFARGVIIWGEPIVVDRDATTEDLEETRQHLEQVLVDLTREADLVVGSEPVLPADNPTGDEMAPGTPS